MVGGPTGGAVVTRAELAGESSPGLARSIPEESAATNGLPPPGWDGQPAHVAEWARQLAAAHAVEARAASIAAAADERDRIAIELHHTVIHRLFAAGLTLSSATAYLATIPASEPSAIIANRHIRDAIGILDETIGAIRVAVYHMPDPDLVERD
jgi:signal transduction histidine kinase